jgi:hypothetical protein
MIGGINSQPPPAPIQKPRIPIWVVGAWPSTKSMNRVLHYDGLLPAVLGKDGKVCLDMITPDGINEMKQFINASRDQATPFDIIVEGQTPGDDPQKAGTIVSSYRDVGVTWWIEALWEMRKTEDVLSRIKQGPPPLE